MASYDQFVVGTVELNDIDTLYWAEITIYEKWL